MRAYNVYKYTFLNASDAQITVTLSWNIRANHENFDYVLIILIYTMKVIVYNILLHSWLKTMFELW